MAVTHTTFGFVGQVGQVEEAKRLSVLGPRFRVATTNDWKLAASGSTPRGITIDPGLAELCGVGDSTSNQELLTCAANGGGSDRYDAILATADWDTEVITFRVLEGTSSPPTVNPSTTTVNPAQINRIPGLQYDALLGVARITPGAGLLTSGQVVDCRTWGGYEGYAVCPSAKYLTMLDCQPGALVWDTSTDIVWNRMAGNVWGFEKWVGSDRNAQPMISLRHLSFTVAHDVMTPVTWPDQVNHGGSLLSVVGNAIRCNVAGRIRVDAYTHSDCGFPGYARLSTSFPAGGGNQTPDLDSWLQRGSGYWGAGVLRVALPSGPYSVKPNDTISMQVDQYNTNSGLINFDCYLAVTYV